MTLAHGITDPRVSSKRHRCQDFRRHAGLKSDSITSRFIVHCIHFYILQSIPVPVETESLVTIRKIIPRRVSTTAAIQENRHIDWATTI